MMCVVCDVCGACIVFFCGLCKLSIFCILYMLSVCVSVQSWVVYVCAILWWYLVAFIIRIF